MAGGYEARSLDRSTKSLIAMVLLALALVMAVPVALLVGVIMMLLGHIIGGLVLFGGSVLVAVAAIVLAGLSGTRQLRKLVSQRSFRILPLSSDDYIYVE
jgi:uncharacterized membrane protein YdjX (TVP38/TMEM64 family)